MQRLLEELNHKKSSLPIHLRLLVAFPGSDFEVKGSHASMEFSYGNQGAVSSRTISGATPHLSARIDLGLRITASKPEPD